MQTTLNLDGAQLTGPTEELFRSWMRERVAVQAIPGSVPVLQQPHLDDGEVYVGAFASADGSYLHHEDSAYAWGQDFGYDGFQGISRKGAALRAVAVRRSPIQPFTHS